MPTFNICRICLGSDVKLYKYNLHELKTYYEQVMGTTTDETEGLPCHFCYECAAMLLKFHKFKEKCFNGHVVLKELMIKGPITDKSIRNINRQITNLQSSLSVISTNHKVRTYIVKCKHTKEHKAEYLDKETPSSEDEDHNDNKNNGEQRVLSKSNDIGNIKVSDTQNENSNEYTDIIQEKIPSTDKEMAFKYFDKENVIEEENEDTDTENVSPSENRTGLTDDERLLSKDLQNDMNIRSDDDIEKQDVVLEKKNHIKINTNKAKRSPKDIDSEVHRTDKISKVKFVLDPKNWLKINLSDKELIEEFRAKAVHEPFTSAKYKCHDCLKTFTHKAILNRHQKLRHNETLGPAECRFCHMRFKWKSYLYRHLREHYTKYKCLRCDLICSMESTALFHEQYHNDNVAKKCPHCDTVLQHQATYYTHLRACHQSEHICTICDESFISDKGLKLHKKMMHDSHLSVRTTT